MRLEQTKPLNKKQLSLSFISFLAEFSNLALCIYLAFLANSLICWIDVFVGVSASIRAGLMTFVFFKIQKNSSEKFNYGMGRLEAFISFICDAFIVIAMLGLFGASIYGLIFPSLPAEKILKYAILKIFNTTFDVIALISQIRLCKKDNNKLKESELQNYIINTTHDVIIGITTFVCYFLRDKLASGYISPIVSILLIFYFIYTCVSHMKSSFRELADVSIPLEQQDEIFDVVLANKGYIKQIKSVNCHVLNNIVYVDISLGFKKEITYDQQEKFLNDVKTSVREKIPDAVVRLVFDQNEN